MRVYDSFKRFVLLGSLSLVLVATTVGGTALRTGTATANPNHTTRSASTVDYALQFDGADDFVSIVDSEGDFDFEYAFTVEAWIKPSSLTGTSYKGIIRGTHWEPPGSGGSWVMFLGDWDLSNWGFSVCTASCGAALSGSGGLIAGQWQHLAGTYDGSSISIYQDGQLVDNTPQSDHVGFVNYVLLGIWDTSFNGLIDEVRLWNIARTQDDIQQSMHRTLSGNEPGLVGYWRLNEGSGQAVLDGTSHHNDGRLGALPGSDDQDPLWVLSDVPVHRLLYLPLVLRGQ